MQPTQALPLLQNLYTSVIWVNADLVIQWVNLQTEQLFSVSKTRLVGLNVLEVLSPCAVNTAVNDASYGESHESVEESQSELKVQFNNAKDYQQPFIKYSRYVKGVAQPIYAHYSVTPVEQEGQSFFLIEIWPGDRQNRIDKEHRLQEQHDVSREMLRSVAHEVKNPLAGIRGAAQLLIKQTRLHQNLDDDPNDEPENATVLVDARKLAAYANIVIIETDRLTHLIEQLLGSNQPPDLQPLNIHEPLEHVLLLTQTQYPTVHIHRDYDLSLPELIADKNQLIQVFLNLVNNACEAMLEQDMTQLDAEYQPILKMITRIEYQYTIGTTYHRQVIKVSIQDNGAGIAPDFIGRIFFPLVTGRASGTGLGLALVQEIVHRHEGAIEVASHPGMTQFDIFLPLAPTNNPNTPS